MRKPQGINLSPKVHIRPVKRGDEDTFLSLIDALADYEKSIQTAFRDVSDALSNQHWLTEQVAIQKGFLAVQTERARLASMRYENGSASFLEVLDAQRDTLSAEQDLVELQRSLLSSRVRLYAALGGGA